jgi:hypothetical protein
MGSLYYSLDILTGCCNLHVDMRVLLRYQVYSRYLLSSPVSEITGILTP